MFFFILVSRGAPYVLRALDITFVLFIYLLIGPWMLIKKSCYVNLNVRLCFLGRAGEGGVCVCVCVSGVDWVDCGGGRLKEEEANRLPWQQESRVR